MYTIKAHVHNSYVRNDLSTLVATAVIKTSDTAAFHALKVNPLANVPDHCHVNVDTFVSVRGYQFPAEASMLGSLIEQLMEVQQELHTSERDARRKPGNGAVHHIDDRPDLA